MDHPARCGMTAGISLLALPSQARDSSCQVESDSDSTFDGYVSLPGSMSIESAVLGLDSTSPFPDALAYATDPVLVFSLDTSLVPNDDTGAITIALEFDNGNGSSTPATTVDYASVMARQYFGF